MNLQGYLSKASIILDLEATDRWEALDEMVSLVLPRSSREYEKVSRSLRDAESKKCSAVGRSVSIIHAITEDVPGLKVVFGRSKEGIPWDAPDGRKVNLLWLLIHPEREQAEYLELLAQAVRLCRRSEVREKLRTAATAEEALEAMSVSPYGYR